MTITTGNNITESTADAQAFLDTLFGKVNECDILIWTVEPKGARRKRSYWIAADKLATAGNTAANLSRTCEVYFGVAPQDAGKSVRIANDEERERAERDGRQPRPISEPYTRGFIESAMGLVGVWAEIDFMGPGHKSDKLPPDVDAAVALVKACGLEPSIIVLSGGGIHAYWLLSNPWLFGSDDDRRRAQALMEQWVRMLQALAADNGWEVDSTFDLARVLRVPGTLNHKMGETRPVRILTQNDDLRYDLGDFEQIIDQEKLARTAPPPPPAPAPPNQRKGSDPYSRCIAYVDKCPPSVSGDKGSNACLRVAAEGWRFGLDRADVRRVLDHYNATKCTPSWSDKELEHKVDDARKKVEDDGKIGIRLKDDRKPAKQKAPPPVDGSPPQDDTGDTPLLDRSKALDKKDPLPTVRKFVRDRYSHSSGQTTLVHQVETFFKWRGNAYAEMRLSELRAELYPWLERHDRIIKLPTGEMGLVPFQPTKGDVDAAVDALRAVVNTSAEPPSWLNSSTDLPDPRHLIVACNGIFDLAGNGKMLSPTPRLFTLNALDYDYDPSAPEPIEWLKFLDVLWPDDRESIELLQEWAGYILTLDTRQQKILLLLGPPRSGKGTISRVFMRMVGSANAIAPTLNGLATPFGLWSLIGKQLAVISDARPSARSDQAIIVERLLSISGEDAIEIHRKMLMPVTQRLTTRIMICTNEIPKLADSSGALPSRFIALPLEQSFLGREDHGLEDRLMAEMPGILNWAIAGWHRLRARGRFEQPGGGQEVMDELLNLASPIKVFIREWCEVKPGNECAPQDAFDAWSAWCAEQGQRSVGTVQTLGRDLRAAIPGLTIGKRRIDGDLTRVFRGLSLTFAAAESGSVFRNRRNGRSEELPPFFN